MVSISRIQISKLLVENGASQKKKIYSNKNSNINVIILKKAILITDYFKKPRALKKLYNVEV